MSAHPVPSPNAFGAALDALERAELPATEIPAALGRLEAMKARLLSALTMPDATDQDTDETYIDAEAVAALCGISRAHVYRLAKGLLRPAVVSLGGALRFSRSKVLTILRSRTGL